MPLWDCYVYSGGTDIVTITSPKRHTTATKLSQWKCCEALFWKKYKTFPSEGVNLHAVLNGAQLNNARKSWTEFNFIMFEKASLSSKSSNKWASFMNECIWMCNTVECVMGQKSVRSVKCFMLATITVFYMYGSHIWF